MIPPPYFFTETTETEIFQINWNNWSKLIGTQPQGNLLFSRRQAQSICFSPQEQKTIGKTLIFLKQTAFQDYFEVQLEIFSYFCKVYFKIFLYGQANYQKKAFPGYHGYIITRDYQTQIKADGYTIEVVPIWKWLLLQDNNQSFKEQKEILDKNRNFPF